MLNQTLCVFSQLNHIKHIRRDFHSVPWVMPREWWGQHLIFKPWLSFVVSSVSLSLSHWYPGSGVVLDCIDSWSLHHYLLFLNMVMWHIKLKEMSSRPEYTEKNTLRSNWWPRDGIKGSTTIRFLREGGDKRWRAIDFVLVIFFSETFSWAL